MSPKIGPYASVPEFIYGITREIWEDRGVGAKLDRYYGPECLVRAATGLTVGNDGILAQTLATLQQFPDRRLIGEDVIWAAYPDGSFLSSHRLISVMRHTGSGSYGEASNRRVVSRIIADCWVKDEVVTEEWLVRDQSAFAACLGMTPRALAEKMVAHELETNGAVSFFSPERDRAGLYMPTIQDDPAAEFYINHYSRIWGGKELSAISLLYFHGAAVEIPGGTSVHGHADLDRFYLGYLAAFPSARFRVHSAIVNRDPGRAVRVALRWSADGCHSGYGAFGAPSGAQVHIMGLSHATIVDGQVRAEWIAIDEVAVYKQILESIRDHVVV